jgi:hypothetical protein
VAGAPRYLDVNSYQPDFSQGRKIFNKRCFLLLDSNLIDYGEFLSKVIPNERRTKSQLSTYRFVYTSLHKEVIEEVRIRKGLKIETLSSLSEKYQAGNLPGTADQGDGLDSQDSVKLHTRIPQAEVQERKPTNEQPNLLTSMSDQSMHQVIHDQSGQELATRTDAEQVNKDSKIVIHLSTEEQSDGDTRDKETTDGRLVALARKIERLFKSPGADRNQHRRRLTILFLLISIAAGLVGTYIVKLLITGGWSVLTGDDRSSTTFQIYYDGCLKLRESGEYVPNNLTKCVPETVANEFVDQLKDCKVFNNHLRKIGDELAQDAYRDDIRRKILASIATYTSYGANNSGSNVAESGTLSSAKSTPFSIQLDFNRSKLCVDQIVSAKDSDFSRKLTDRSPSREEVAGANPKANKSPEKEQNRIVHNDSRPPQTLPATRVHPQGSRESTPEKTPSPVVRPSPNTIEGANTNVARPPSETQTPQSITDQKTNTNQKSSQTTRSNNSNAPQRATPSQATPPKRRRGKKGRS